MNSNFEDLSSVLENHCSDVEHLMEALTAFHDARERTYNLSFARRGESGVWMNLARKYDRLDLLAARVLEGQHNSNDGVTLVDTLVDTAMYALKWVSVIRSIRPADFQKWVEQVYCRDTGKSVEEALVEFNIHGPKPLEDVSAYFYSTYSGRLSCSDSSLQSMPMQDEVDEDVIRRIPIYDSIEARVGLWYDWHANGICGPSPVHVGELIADIRKYAPNVEGGGIAAILDYRKRYMAYPVNENNS